MHLRGTDMAMTATYPGGRRETRNPDPNRSVGFGEASTAEMMFGMFEFTAADGVSPKPSTPRSRMQILRSSFADSACLVDLVLPNQTIPSVLHIPRSGEGAWYVPTFGMITVAPIRDIRVGRQHLPVHRVAARRDGSRAVRGQRQRAGGWIDPRVGRTDRQRARPFKEFTGSAK